MESWEDNTKILWWHFEDESLWSDGDDMGLDFMMRIMAINLCESWESLCLVCAVIQTCHNISATHYTLHILMMHTSLKKSKFQEQIYRSHCHIYVIFFASQIWTRIQSINLWSRCFSFLFIQNENDLNFFLSFWKERDKWEIMLCYSRVVNFGFDEAKMRNGFSLTALMMLLMMFSQRSHEL